LPNCTMSIRQLGKRLSGGYVATIKAAEAKKARIEAIKARNQKRVKTGELLGSLVMRINADGTDLGINHDMTVRELLMAMTLEVEE
jgi:hypothetical protein